MEQRIIPVTNSADLQPRSKFELFDAQQGVLRMKEFYKLTPPALKYAKSEAMLIRYTDTQNWEMNIALNLKFQGAERERTTYLDEEEIGQLARAVAYMLENQANIIRVAKTYTEMVYTSRTGFAAGFYVHEDRTSEGFISIDGEIAFLQSLTELEKIADEALFKIELMRRGGGRG